MRLNIYQALLLGAMKFHAYAKALPTAPAPGSRLLVDALDTGVAFMCTLVRRRKVAPTALHGGGALEACSCQVPRVHIRWLAVHAFHRVLTRKQAAYRALLLELEQRMAAPAYRHLAVRLADVVYPARSSAFNDIRY